MCDRDVWLKLQITNIHVIILYFRSQEWNFIPEEQKQEMGLTFDDDGEFWQVDKTLSNS